MSLWLPPMDNDFDDFFVAAGTVLAGEYGELADWRTSPLGHSPQVPSLSTSSSYLQSHAAEDDTGWVNSPATALSNGAALLGRRAREVVCSRPPVVYPTLSEAALREPVRLPSPQADLTLGKYTSQARQERLDRWRAKRVLLMQRANDAPAINYTQRQHIVRRTATACAIH